MTSGLAEIQRWLHTVVVEPGDLARKLRVARAQDDLGVEDVVAASGGAPILRRLEVYSRGYVMRLVECLRTDFPALNTYLGESVFDAFARAYVMEHPSHSPSLFELGSGFADFLERTRPDGARLDEPQRALLDLPAAMARLERAVAEAQRAPGLEGTAPSVSVPLAWEVLTGDTRVQAAPCLRLLDLPFPVVEFVESIERGEWSAPPAPSRCLIAVSRARYRVTRLALEPWQHRFLIACDTPAPVAELAAALARNAVDANPEPGALLARLVSWLPRAADSGLVCVSLGSRTSR